MNHSPPSTIHILTDPALLDAVPCQVAVVDAEGNAIHSNRAWRDFSGRIEGKLSERSGEALFHRANPGPDLDRLEKGLAGLLEGKLSHFEGDLSYQGCEGTVRVGVHVGSLPGVSGAVIVTRHEMGRLQQVEERLQQLSSAGEQDSLSGEERFRRLAEEAPVGIYQTDARGQCTYVNRRWCELAGLIPEEAAGDGWCSALYPADRQRIELAWTSFARGEAPFSLEYRFQHEAGTVVWVSGRAAALRERGQVTGYIGTVQDITARKDAEAKVRSLDRLHEAILEATNYAVISGNTEGVITSFNAAAERMLGYSADEVVGRATPALWHDPEEVANRATELTRLLGRKIEPGLECFTAKARLGPPDEAEWTFIRKDGSRFPVTLTVTALKDESDVITGWLGVIGDITQRRAVEERARNINRELEQRIAERTTELAAAEAERTAIGRRMAEAQKMESLGVLAGGVAHDFNNLLGAILGNSCLAMDALAPGSPAMEFLQVIRKETERAAELCRQMLAYAGRGKFVVEATDLNSTLRETADLLQVSVGKRIQVQFELAPGLPAVTVDAVQFRQIVMNLLLNSADAIGDRAGRIVIRTGRAESSGTPGLEYIVTATGPQAQGEFVFFEVEDDGVGIRSEDLPRIFEPFFTTKFTGRGLGLSAVMGIVRSHQGSLGVRSAPGLGTTFRILLPPSVTEAPSISPMSRPSPPAASRQHRGMALVIDDERTMREVLAKMLRALGVETRTTASGEDGLRCFSEAPREFHFILVDLTMPGMDGGQTCRKLREVREGIPLAVMSGYSEHEVQEQVGHLGGVEYLSKPFSLDELRQLVQKMLGERAGER